MKKVVISAVMLLTVVVMAAGPAVTYAEDMSASQQKIMESTGVPVYPGATYTTGDDEIATVLWFRTMDSPDRIMDWYKGKLSGWSEIVLNGSRVIYKGPTGKEAKDLSTMVHIWARITSETPGSKNSEITVRIPK